MNESRTKLKRVKPLIRARKAQMDQEAGKLAKIRQSKMEALQKLEEEQKKYISGVDMLNETRQSGNFESLSALEDGLDFVKTKWVETLRDVREFEAEENAQMAQLLYAQRNLKSVEKLEEIYQEGSAKHEAHELNKELEETALRGFRRNG